MGSRAIPCTKALWPTGLVVSDIIITIITSGVLPTGIATTSVLAATLLTAATSTGSACARVLRRTTALLSQTSIYTKSYRTSQQIEY